MEKYIKPPEQNTAKAPAQVKKLHWSAECFLGLATYIALFYAIRYTMLTVLGLLIPCVYICVRRGWVAGIAFYILCGASTYLLQPQQAIILSAVGLLPFAVSSYVLRAKQKPFVCIMAVCGAALAAAGCAMLVLNKIADGNIAQYLTDLILTKAAADPATALNVSTTLISTDLAAGNLTQEQALELLYLADPLAYIQDANSIRMIKGLIEAQIPELLVTYIGYGGLAAFYVPWLFARMAGQPMARFPVPETWILPKQHGYYMAATCALGYLCMVFGDPGMVAPAQMLFSLTVIAFCMVGASVVCFFLGARIKDRSGRVAIAAAMYLFLPGLLASIGIIEQLFGIRKRIVIIKPQPKGGNRQP